MPINMQYQQELADYIKRTNSTTKEDILNSMAEAKKRISIKSETDKKHSAAYYHILEKLICDFTKEIEQTVLFEKLEECWFYRLYVTYSGIKLSLEHAIPYDNRCGDHPNYGVDQTFILLMKNAKLLSVEEYANVYGVETVTVRQWIRRGKIRNAVKSGREWLIPELTELPGRGYTSAVYMWYEYLYDLPNEYKFLTDYTTVLINQCSDDRTKYEITFAAGGVKPLTKIYGVREREKLELFLISDPRIHYTESFLDEPQDVVFR